MIASWKWKHATPFLWVLMHARHTPHMRHCIPQPQPESPHHTPLYAGSHPFVPDAGRAVAASFPVLPPGEREDPIREVAWIAVDLMTLALTVKRSSTDSFKGQTGHFIVNGPDSHDGSRCGCSEAGPGPGRPTHQLPGEGVRLPLHRHQLLPQLLLQGLPTECGWGRPPTPPSRETQTPA